VQEMEGGGGEDRKRGRQRYMRQRMAEFGNTA